MSIEPTDRTKLNRLPERGKYDPETIYGILDAMPMCQIAYLFDGKPAILPTLQWREGDHVFGTAPPAPILTYTAKIMRCA